MFVVDWVSFFRYCWCIDCLVALFAWFTVGVGQVFAAKETNRANILNHLYGITV